VEVALLSDDTDLLVHVTDSGPGVAPEIADSLFDHGFTTRELDATGHGIGLALARHTARAHRGDVRLLSRRADTHGAVFEARMVDVLAHQVLPERTAT
jgi:two-component system, CitB family, sensor kinase